MRLFPKLFPYIGAMKKWSRISVQGFANSWKGSFEGWFPGAGSFKRRMKKELPGLKNFYMVGQWVEPGGGLPTSLMSGRGAAQVICKRDGKAFTTA